MKIKMEKHAKTTLDKDTFSKIKSLAEYDERSVAHVLRKLLEEALKKREIPESSDDGCEKQKTEMEE